MARAHEVAIGADGRDFNRAIKSDVIKPVELAARSLDELGDDGAKDLGKLESALRDVQKQSDKVDRSLKDIDSTSRKTWDNASDNVQGFKQEAISNIGEIGASFKGDIQDMADGVQGLTGGLASALTPGIGIPVAILGAAAGAFLQSWITASEDSKERVQDMYSAMAEDGSKFLSEDFLNKAIGELDTSKIEEAQRKAVEFGVTERDVVRAMVGDREAIGRLLADQQQRRQAELQTIRDSGKSIEDQAVAVDAVNAKYGTQTDWLRDIQRDTGTATGLWETFNEAMYKTPGAVDQASAAVSRFKQLHAGGITIPVRIDTGPLTNAQIKLNELQRQANRGIDVVVRQGQVVWN